MRFMVMYKPDKNKAAGSAPNPERMAKMDEFVDEMTKSGVLLSTGGMFPVSMGARVTLSGGKFTVTDGPFSEAKEVVAGYAIVRLASKEEAIEMTKRFLAISGEGETDIRQLTD